jgi:hypothetical protein
MVAACSFNHAYNVKLFTNDILIPVVKFAEVATEEHT